MVSLNVSTASVADGDAKCLFYTGLSWETVFTVYQFLEKFNDGQCKRSSIDQLFITLTEL